MFRELNQQETKEFQQWADDNYVPGSTINQTWHPVVQKRCAEINQEVLVESKANQQAQDAYKELVGDLDEMLDLLNIKRN